jgi:trans-2,3-dihydro-3-hydroxyanthranilate isomerase
MEGTMMEKKVFYIVDVFAQERFAGNQLAVFRSAGDLPDRQMQRLANEMNYSETTFILSDQQRGGGYDVRIFTPREELPFAGHPTLGTAYVIQREIVKEQIDRIVLNLKVGQIPVTLDYEGGKITEIWMKQIAPIFGRIHMPESLPAVLSLETADIDDRFPVQEVSTGVPFMIVPLKSLDALKRATVVKDRYFELIRDTEAKAILIFCPESHRGESQLSVRVFADYYGVPEDPATGSANGCLAGYLAKHRYMGVGRIDIKAEQGYEMGRPSSLLLRAEEKGEKTDVLIGGKVIMIARGELIQ